MYLKLNVIDVYMKCILLFPIITVLPDKGIITKILFVLLVLGLVAICIKYRVKKKTVKHMGIMSGLYLITLLQTQFPMSNYNMLFYYPFYIVFSFFLMDNGSIVLKWIRKNEKIVRAVIKIWTCIVGVSIFLPSCYYIKEGGARYFGSFVNSIFRLGPAAICIQAFVLISMSLYKRRKDIIYMIVPMYAYFMGSSRTYLVVGGFLFLIAWYWFGVKKTTFIATCIPLVLIGGYLMVHSSMWDKILYTFDSTQYGDFWFRFTSSRSMLWAKDLNAWKAGNILQKICGSGIERTIYASGLWAHNDFIEILCSFGISGVFQYIYVTICLMKKYFDGCRKMKLIKVCAVMTWFMNAFFNMHYTYFCATLGYPFVLLAISEYCQKRTIRKVGY